MKRRNRKITIRTALLSVMILSLLAAATAFLGASAAKNTVSDSDVSNSDNAGIMLMSLDDDIMPLSDLGEPQIVMTTGKAVGDTLDFSLDISEAYVDWGDGNPVLYSGAYFYSGTLQGDTVKIYSDEDITYFNCCEQELTSLAVSNCTALKNLNCGGNYLTSLDVSNCTALIYLVCSDNNLTSLDVSKNTALDILFCDYNNLTSLDVSNCTALTTLVCHEDKLTSLDISKNTALTDLECGWNNLTSLDVSKNTALTSLGCSSNNLTSLDISKNTALINLWCNSNNLTSLDVSKNTALGSMECGDNNITSLDVSQNAELELLACYSNLLSSLDVSTNTMLTALQCANNMIGFTTLKIGNADLNFTNEDKAISWLGLQKYIPAVSEIDPNGQIDLSSEYDINGTKTIYTWYNSNHEVVTPTSSSNGVFTFGYEFADTTLYCSMTNTLFTDMELQTTSVYVKPISFEVVDKDSTDFVANATPSNDISITDEDGNIVDIDDVKLVIGNIDTDEKKTVLDAIAKHDRNFDPNTKNCAVYDVSLTDGNGVKVKVENGKIKICLKYPDNLGRKSENYSYKLYHQKSDGSIEEIAITCKSDGIWFEADDFSPYALVWTEKTSTGSDVKSPGTGESSTITIVAIILVVIAVAAIALVVVRNVNKGKSDNSNKSDNSDE